MVWMCLLVWDWLWASMLEWDVGSWSCPTQSATQTLDREGWLLAAYNLILTPNSSKLYLHWCLLPTVVVAVRLIWWLLKI